MNKKEAVIQIPLDEFETVDVSEKAVEAQAAGFILGSSRLQKNRDLKIKLEQKVHKRIGVKGKLLTDKLFELIEGIYIVDKRGGAKGSEIKYYQVPPSLAAIQYAMDRILGKPTQHTEHIEEKTGILTVEHIIKGLVGKNDGEQKNGKVTGSGESKVIDIGVKGDGDEVDARLSGESV